MLNVASNPGVSRRHVLIGAAALALLSTAAACGAKTPPPDVSALVTQLDLARSDSQLAAGAASAARPPLAAALTTVVSERTAHAEALSAEITRVTGQSPSPATTPTSTSSMPTSGEPLPPPTPHDVVVALANSAGSAAQAAAGQSGYRAGLLGSIAAACTAAYTVALAEVTP
jgi:hypothetical protein